MNERWAVTCEDQMYDRSSGDTYACARFAGHYSYHAHATGSWTDGNHWIDPEIEDAIRESEAARFAPVLAVARTLSQMAREIIEVYAELDDMESLVASVAVVDDALAEYEGGRA